MSAHPFRPHRWGMGWYDRLPSGRFRIWRTVCMRPGCNAVRTRKR
jgi:hypothetical protein